MQKTVDKIGKSFMIQSEGSAFVTGYGVYFKHADGKRGSVQFGVLLSASMELVSIPYKINGNVSKAEFDICKEIVSEELEANPSVFHIVENGRTERDMLRRALQQAIGFNHVDSADPEAAAIEKRISDLSLLIDASIVWSHDPMRVPYKEFLAEYRSNTFEKIVLPEPVKGSIQLPMGPYDLVDHVRKMEAELGTIAVVRTGDALSRVPYAVADHRDYGWPLPWKFPEEESKWVHFNRLDFQQDRSARARDILSRSDTLVLCWTRRTDVSAFERIASVVSRAGDDPQVVIGSPEGTIIGRANEIRLAMQGERPLAPAF